MASSDIVIPSIALRVPPRRFNASGRNRCATNTKEKLG
jgi:hypothetical protein